MAKVIPFQGVLYNPDLVEDMREVVAPPYDVIDPPTQTALYSRHPNNVVRLEFGVDEPGDDSSHNRYLRAAQYLQDWLKSGVLRRDQERAIYPYAIEYKTPGREGVAKPLVLKGFLSLLELEEFGAGRVMPHENTRTAAKNDRLNLLQACRANFSPIFSLFSDPEGMVSTPIENIMASQKPRIEFRDGEGFYQRLWAVTDAQTIQTVVAAMKPKPLFIADGHHRYETALTFRDLQRAQAASQAGANLQSWESVLMLFARLEDPGLTVLPTHRVLKTAMPDIEDIRNKLHKDFTIKEFGFGKADEPQVRSHFLHSLRECGQRRQAYGLALRNYPKYVLLERRAAPEKPQGTSPRERLDVSVLHVNILGPLSIGELSEDTVVYTKDDDEALDLVLTGKAGAAFLLNPTKVSEVSAVASAGERMPHKSTYFFPKPLTGLVINVMKEG